jgi:hypothetical protein
MRCRSHTVLILCFCFLVVRFGWSRCPSLPSVKTSREETSGFRSRCVMLHGASRRCLCRGEGRSVVMPRGYRPCCIEGLVAWRHQVGEGSLSYVAWSVSSARVVGPCSCCCRGRSFSRGGIFSSDCSVPHCRRQFCVRVCDSASGRRRGARVLLGKKEGRLGND